MKFQLLWSTGLYSINIVAVSGDIANIDDTLPLEFTDGTLSRFVELETGYNSRLEGSIFRIYSGLESRDQDFVENMLKIISEQLLCNHYEINNIDDVKAGGQSVLSLKKNKT